MAVACAAAELLRRRALGLDLVFLIEGEEEAGSTGFADAVRKHKVTHLCLLDIFLARLTRICAHTGSRRPH
jgi:di- and tripeptidase